MNVFAAGNDQSVIIVRISVSRVYNIRIGIIVFASKLRVDEVLIVLRVIFLDEDIKIVIFGFWQKD